VRGFLSYLLHFVFPDRCIVCGGQVDTCPSGLVLPGGWPGGTVEFIGSLQMSPDDPFPIGNTRVVCRNCLFTLEPSGGSYSTIESDAAPDGEVRVISPFFINDTLLGLVHDFKFRGARVVGAALSWWMALCLGDYIDGTSVGMDDLVLVPVPLHPSRKRERGYNQSEVLAGLIARRLKTSMTDGALVRKRRTKRQSNLSEEERSANVRRAFRLNSNREIKGKVVVLVDDLVTTGATASACIQELVTGRPMEIIVLCAGRSRRRLRPAE